jgi:CelD/BcsL family acetyltransferase involved in cellulose biosynthesis
MIQADILTELAELEPVRADWDRLAVDNGLPTMSPAWGLAWWRRFAPERAALRVVVVRDCDEVVGIAPFFVRTEGAALCDLLGEDTGRHAPLALPGREWPVAEAAARALTATEPAPTVVRFMSAPFGPWHGPWLAALRLRDNGRRMRTIVRQSRVVPCPQVLLSGTFDGWFSGRSANFRSEMRRLRKRFAEAGAAIRVSDPTTVDDDLRIYMKLHLGRWEGRRSLYEGTESRVRTALGDMAHALPPERFRLYVAELDGVPIAAQLFLAAGGEIMYHNGGWDETYARLKPGMVGLLHAIEQGYALGDRRLDLGPKAQPYKLRFANSDDPIVAVSVASLGPDLAGFAARRALRRGAAMVKQRLDRR